MPIQSQYVYTILHKQILVMMGLSLLPGLGYIFLGWINDIVWPAIGWYLLVSLISLWGYRLHKEFHYSSMGSIELQHWHKRLSIFYYLIFGSWALIFSLYAGETQSKMHYIAIFTELGASVVATTLLYADRKTLRPILLILMLPLTIYFALIGELYAYVLSIFSLIFLGVLFYSANSSDRLLLKTHAQASNDQLTGISNRHTFINALQQKINGIQKSKGFSYLLLIDLDHFKTVNDTLGHDIGDKLLEEVSSRMQQIQGENDLIARLGGDEFIFLGEEFSSQDEGLNQAMHISEQLLESIKTTYIINGHHIYLSASIGVSPLDPDTSNANTFIKAADIAMYEVKEKGRDGVVLFNEALSKRVEKRLRIEQNLHFALKREEIYLHYQPQLDINEKLIGCEVLARWENKELGLVPPDIFISISEQTGLILELGSYILEESFKTLRQWGDEGIELEQFSINISMRQFLHADFSSEVKRLCQQHLNAGLQSKLVFEMTETLLAEDIPRVISVMNALKNLGIDFSMDDFGTGYSSLSYLQQMPISELKIDRSFINKLSDKKSDQQMIDIILAMAKSFDLRVVAEGVESAEQSRILTEKSCDIFQGYLYSKPLSKEDFEALYKKTSAN